MFSVPREGEEDEFEIVFWNEGEKGKGKVYRGETKKMGARERSRREKWRNILLLLFKVISKLSARYVSFKPV